MFLRQLNFGVMLVIKKLLRQLLIQKRKCSISIPDFSISRLGNVEDFFNVNIFFKCKYVRINDYLFKYASVVCCVKISFYYIVFSAMLNLNSADFTTPNQSSEILILKIEMLLEFQNKTNSKIVEV